jgi:peptidoglycan hydrolase-like protein with peptidoglycan-binding domain
MVQRMLNQKGFNIGEPDGRFGPNTRHGLEAFQRQEGLQVTGEIDHPTLAALGVPPQSTTGG